MRILFWSELFWPYAGGPELLGAKLLPALAARGHDFLVVSSHDHLDLPEQDRFYGIPIYRFPFRAALSCGDIEQMLRIRREIARLRDAWMPELTHINALGPSAIFNVAAKEASTVVTLHTLHGQFDNARRAGADTLLKKVLASASWVTCVSEAVLWDASEQAPEIAAYSSVIYNGVAEPEIPCRPLSFAAPRLLCLGRLVSVKGFDLALKAFSRMSDRFPHARLVIAGDGPVRSLLEEQAHELGIKDRVDFTGWIPPDKVPDLINTVTMLIMPSRREGLPLVGIEAAQMGRPVVATRVGGLPEITVHQETGLLVDKEDVDGLTEAIVFVLDHPEVASRMGEAARHRAGKMFNFNRCVDAYDTLYRRFS